MCGRPFLDGRFPFTEFDSFVNNSVTLTPLQYQNTLVDKSVSFILRQRPRSEPHIVVSCGY